jgi:NodT family efflux transporter outer membrane factor (OMF) lipoprotein
VQRYTEHGLVPRDIAGDHRADNRFALDLQYELDLFGKNKSIGDSAAAQSAAVEIDLYTARLGLASAIAQAWFSLAQATAERTVIASTLEQRRKVLELVMARVGEGLDSKVEQRQAEGLIPQSAEELAAVDERIGLLRSALASLAVLPLAETARLSPILDTLAGPSLPGAVPSDLLARRPDVAAARMRIDALLKGVDAVQAEFYPSVNLTAFAGFSAIGLDELLQAGSQVYGFAPTIRLPIFDAGRLRAKLKFVNAQLDMAIADYNQALLLALREVTDSLTSIRALHARTLAQRDALSAAESAYDIAVQRFKAGLTGYLTVLATESEVLRERRAAVLLAARAYELDIDLKRALGGGFTAPVATALREQE